MYSFANSAQLVSFSNYVRKKEKKKVSLPPLKVQHGGGNLKHRGLRLQVGCSKRLSALLGSRGLGLSRLQNLLSN